MKHDLSFTNSKIITSTNITFCNPFPHLWSTHIHNYNKFLFHKTHIEETVELFAKNHLR